MAQELETKTKIAIVGTGFGARVQIPGFLKIAGVEICGVMSSGRYERAEEVAQEFGIANVCHSYEELLALPGLDAVSIVTPPYQHHSQTLAALEAGKHVLCEKPMAMNLQEAREMVKAVQRTGLIGMIDHEFRYIPARAYAQELIRDGWLGELYWANISTLTGTAADPHTRPYGWLFQKSAGGGFLGALGSHYLDALRCWFGEISAVLAQLSTFIKQRPLPGSNELRDVDVDDSFTLLLKMASGAQATIKVSVVTRFGGGERIELYGSGGTLIIDSEGKLQGARANDDRLQILPIPARYTSGPSSSDPRLRPFVTLAEDFVEGIRAAKVAGKPLGQEIEPSFADGLKVQQVLDAARASAETNCWVSLPPPR